MSNYTALEEIKVGKGEKGCMWSQFLLAFLGKTLLGAKVLGQ